MFGKKESGKKCISSEQLQDQSHLLYCFAASGSTNIKASCFLGITEDQYSMLGDHLEIDVPIEKELLKENLRAFVGRYSGAEIANNLPIYIGVSSGAWEIVILADEAFDFNVITVAVSRRTLGRSIYFQYVQPRLSPHMRFLQLDEVRIHRSLHKPRRAEITRIRCWAMRHECQNSAIERRELGFYFQDEEFGIMLQSTPILENA